MSHPDIPESDEIAEHRSIEALLGADWSTRFHQHSAAFIDVGTELLTEQEPEKVVKLVERKGGASISVLGANGLNLVRRRILIERADFEARFSEG